MEVPTIYQLYRVFIEAGKHLFGRNEAKAENEREEMLAAADFVESLADCLSSIAIGFERGEVPAEPCEELAEQLDFMRVQLAVPAEEHDFHETYDRQESIDLATDLIVRLARARTFRMGLAETFRALAARPREPEAVLRTDIDLRPVEAISSTAGWCRALAQQMRLVAR